MQLHIRGHNGNIARKEVKQVLTWSATELLGNLLANNVDLYVNFVMMASKQDGFLTNMDDRTRNPRIFEMELNCNMSRRKTILTICHEMVHLKQYAKNELRDTGHFDITRYRNEIFDNNMYKYDKDTPWEIEAYDTEKTLYRKYIAKMRQKRTFS